MKENNYFTHKLILYILGLLILAIGSNLFINASLGVAPSCTLALSLSQLFPPFGYALFNFITNGILLLAEAFLVRKFSHTQCIQLVLIILYSFFIQMLAPVVSIIMPHTLFTQILTCIVACIVLAIGASFTIASNFTVLPMEGFIGVMALKKHQEFGHMRIRIEVTMTIGVALFSLLTLQNLSSIGIGTIIAAYCTGKITSWFTSTFHHQLDAYIGKTPACCRS